MVCNWFLIDEGDKEGGNKEELKSGKRDGK